MLRFVTPVLIFLSGCAETPQTLVFDIAANTHSCVGAMQQRCLIVNGEYFYDGIEGYEHQEGKAAKINVLRTRRTGPVPADASIFVYRRVP